MKYLPYVIVGLLLFSSLAVIGVGNEAGDTQNALILEKKIIASPYKISPSNLDGNVQISENVREDMHPRMTTNGDDVIVVVYEQELDIFTKETSISYSDDDGETWTQQFAINSLTLFDMSGVTQYPDIAYMAGSDQLWFTMVDPLFESWNNMMGFMQGDITTAEDASLYAVSGTGSENYFANAAVVTENYLVSVTTEDGYGFEQLFGLGYWTAPDFEHPEVMGGFYYDGNSEHASAPAAEIEMDTNSNRIFLVCETETGEGTQITMKSTVNDEALLTNGEMQNGMDKYADIEQWSGEYMAAGTDPDVSGSGNKVCVVYEQGGDVKCSYSTCDAGTYDPGFDWQVSTVATGANYPAVFMKASVAYCAYVQDENLYYVVSEDAGATWGEPTQVNTEEGTVVEEKGTVDIHESGMAFTDNRNGNKDIFFAPLAGVAAPDVVIKSIKGGIGITATIENEGNAAAENFAWSIVSDGLVFIGGEKSGQATLAPGESMDIKTGFMLGFGDIEVTVTADLATQKVNAKLLLFFVTGL